MRCQRLHVITPASDHEVQGPDLGHVLIAQLDHLVVPVEFHGVEEPRFHAGPTVAKRVPSDINDAKLHGIHPGLDEEARAAAVGSVEALAHLGVVVAAEDHRHAEVAPRQGELPILGRVLVGHGHDHVASVILSKLLAEPLASLIHRLDRRDGSVEGAFAVEVGVVADQAEHAHAPAVLAVRRCDLYDVMRRQPFVRSKTAAFHVAVEPLALERLNGMQQRLVWHVALVVPEATMGHRHQIHALDHTLAVVQGRQQVRRQEVAAHRRDDLVRLDRAAEQGDRCPQRGEPSQVVNIVNVQEPECDRRGGSPGRDEGSRRGGRHALGGQSPRCRRDRREDPLDEVGVPHSPVFGQQARDGRKRLDLVDVPPRVQRLKEPAEDVE
mmetsp:Transcript_124585/g.360303  ORF Transcript_124585/g.360303 Transcript_124585/m.360303 type:complete len:382 (-) Transcript_124585:205-1350(-)